MQGMNKNIIVNVFIADKNNFDLKNIKEQITGQIETLITRKRNQKKKSKLITRLNYLDKKEVKKLRHFMEKQRQTALKKNNKTAIKHWFFVEVGLFTGLRVEEITKLCCSDYCIKDNSFILIVRKGKGDKPGIVVCPDKFKKSWFWFLEWKTSIGESIEKNSPVFYSSRTKTHISTRALQYALKDNLIKASIDGKYTPHSMRKTYGTYLNDVSNTRLTQIQLRHENIRTTQGYTFPIDDTLKKAVKKLSDLFE